MDKHGRGAFDRARDELYSHIHRCGVLEASEEQQTEWMEETIEFLSERYPSIDESDLNELRMLGLRFCKPAIPHGHQPTATEAGGANAA